MTDSSLALTVLRAVISLALVLVLLVVSMRVLARRSGMAPSPRSVPVVVDLLGRRQLTRGASVQVVKVGSRVLVLGVTDTEVSVLTHLSPSEVAADGKQADVDTPPTFVEALRRQGRSGRRIADISGRRNGGRHRGGSRV